MRPSVLAFGLSLVLSAPAAFAQDGARPTSRFPFGLGRGSSRPDPAPAPAPAAPAGAIAAGTSEKADPKVFPATSALPTPTPPDQIKPATLVLPNDPIGPYLLTRDQGPFMVMAKTFRGPDAERFALALAKELRQEYGLPAYILRTKDFPMRSIVRPVPPMAPKDVRKSNLGDPERVRTHDEAAVLVGNCKTLDESEALWKRVKKIKPNCLNEIPQIYWWRKDLSAATRTTNPYVPAQDLFPGRGPRDHLLARMNAGPRSIVHCPARYTLQVADFTGRATFNPDKKAAGFFGNDSLRSSPLITAADDAERLADVLAKDPEVQRTGFQPYVYHDLTSSKVMVGAFNRPDDPAAAKLREVLLRRWVAIADQQQGRIVMAPANALTDLEDPNKPIKQMASSVARQ